MHAVMTLQYQMLKSTPAYGT